MKGNLCPALLRALGATLACSVLLVAYAHIAFHDLPDPARMRALVSALVLPWVMGFPVALGCLFHLDRLKARNRDLLRLAATDALTRCLNRAAFTRQVSYSIMPHNGFSPCGGALLIIDADNFKRVNDRFGHQAGDRALAIIADAIRRSLRQADVVGRMGGEEFAVLLPGVTLDAAAQVANRLRLAVEASPFDVAGERYGLTISIGGVAYERAQPFESLFQQADARLYAAKRSGRNAIDIVSFQASDAVAA